MITAGAQVDHCHDAAEDRKQINTSPVPLQFQKEVGNGLELQQTAAGKCVVDEILQQMEKRDQELNELRNRLANHSCNSTDESVLQKELRETSRMLKEAEKSIKDLQTQLQELRKSFAALENEKGKWCIIL